MRKLVLTTVAVAALAGSAVAFNAFAAPGDPPDGPRMPGMAEHGFMLDARLAGMKAALKLTSEQEKSWAPFEAAVRDAAKARGDAMRARHEEMEKDEHPSPIARLDEMSDHLAMDAAELKKVADSARPLFDGLDDTQKRHFGPLLMSLREPPPPRHGERHGPWEHREDSEPL
jgi:Spy/CpxP family protein refolding chaperone